MRRQGLSLSRRSTCNGLCNESARPDTLASWEKRVGCGANSEQARDIDCGNVLTIPSSVGLAVLGKSIIGAIYQGGRFQLYDTQQTAVALSCYAIGLAGYAAVKVIAPAYYALGDARTPMLVSIASVLVNLGAAEFLIRGLGLGHAALALTTSMVARFAFFVLFELLRRRMGGVHGRELAASGMKVLAASAAMAAITWFSSREMEKWLGTSQLARLADLAVSIPLGVVVFYGICRALGVAELSVAIRAFTNPITRRIKREVR